jgi:1-aminocyclopropane-1-carboxylate deaminase/D-cysteine desulfhydrase-like pyridoxal-dependent ACC family enzyme
MKWYDELKAEGKRPYALPLGGSTPHGTLGYVKAMEELRGQLEDDKVQIFCPVGSCGTLAGVVLGAALFLPNAKVYGISVSRNKENIYERTRELIKGSAKLIGADPALCETEFFVYDCYHEEYAKHIKIAMDAGEVCARLEGMIVDQVYTGKAMAGLFDLALTGVLNKEEPVIFLHTGGMPEVFSDTLRFGEYDKCRKYSVEEVQEMKK